MGKQIASEEGKRVRVRWSREVYFSSDLARRYYQCMCHHRPQVVKAMRQAMDNGATVEELGEQARMLAVKNCVDEKVLDIYLGTLKHLEREAEAGRVVWLENGQWDFADRRQASETSAGSKI